MSTLAAAIAAAADGNPAELLEQCKHLPTRPGPAVDPQSDDDPGPISAGDSFDDVTTAWIAGRLTDDVYRAALAAVIAVG